MNGGKIAHMITVRAYRPGLGATSVQRALIKRAVRAALEAQGIEFSAQVAVTLADDAYIRELNEEHRGVDAATDVLSFPLLSWTDGAGDAPVEADYDLETDTVPLGDIVMSLERVQAQAEEYGHSVRRECGFLAVHSTLHLLGFDHENGGERRTLMRRREEEILASLGSDRG